MLPSERSAPPNQIGRRRSGSRFRLCQSLWVLAFRHVPVTGHVVLVQLLDGVPVQMQFAGNVRHRAAAAPSPYIPGKPLCIERVVGQKVESLAFHLSTVPAQHPSNLDFQIDAYIAIREVANSSMLLVVPTGVSSSTGVADCFFEHRMSVMIRALESPKMPRIFSSGRNRYVSRGRLRLGGMAIEKSSHFLQHVQNAFCPRPQGLQRISC